MNAPRHLPVEAGDWPAPDLRFLAPVRPPPPAFPLEAVFGPRWAAWVRQAAEAKGAPADYVMGALIAVVGALVGNSRWPNPWSGWAEPPILWTCLIGNPSAGKSPALDAVLGPLRKVEQVLRKAAQAERSEWQTRAEVARIGEAAWREAVKAALKDGTEPPPRSETTDPGPEPVIPRLAVNDATVEKVAVIVAGQPRGLLAVRDELAGWLLGMMRYSSGSDRPFWLEAYGGRSYAVERMGREAVYVPHLSVGVLGGIQPDRLRSLLMKAGEDDGLLARLLPLWPDPAPIRRPEVRLESTFAEEAFSRLLSLEMARGEDGEPRPWFVPFTEEAQEELHAFRCRVRTWETGAEGLLLSFLGKLPGVVVRLSLVLAFLDWAAGEPSEAGAPTAVTAGHLARSVHLVEVYLRPMAERAYTDASVPKEEQAARKLLALIREKGWQQFSTREVLRAERAGLGAAAELDPALVRLTAAHIVRPIASMPGERGGRRERLFSVNPAVLGDLGPE